MKKKGILGPKLLQYVNITRDKSQLNIAMFRNGDYSIGNSSESIVSFLIIKWIMGQDKIKSSRYELYHIPVPNLCFCFNFNEKRLDNF